MDMKHAYSYLPCPKLPKMTSNPFKY